MPDSSRVLPAIERATLLASGPPIVFIRQAVGETSFYAEVGLKDVARIEVVQETGTGGRDTGDIWLVVFDGEGPRFRVLASHAVVGYRPRLTGAPEVPPPVDRYALVKLYFELKTVLRLDDMDENWLDRFGAGLGLGAKVAREDPEDPPPFPPKQDV